ncbi:hypothetical protein F9C11_05450 [Amycolatopsis sp. VS8301801F10]|uniref:hypothetical protein n=1 Tax=Amycolatopsis sp. VS8301801F10 TaxID=2652442 RepID=UPI0038FD2F4A
MPFHCSTPCDQHGHRWCGPCYGVGDDYELTTISITVARVLANNRVVEKDPKSDNAFRELPGNTRESQ